MRVRHLHRRARPFRYGGFALLGGCCLALAATGHAPLPALLAAAACFVWPGLADCLSRRCPARLPRAAWDAAVFLAECAVTAALLVVLQIPALPALAAAVCLLSGAMALAGWRLLLAASAALLLGLLTAAALGPAPGTGAGVWGCTPGGPGVVDLLAMLLLVSHTVALAGVSFGQAQRLDARRQVLAARSADLERVNGHMQRYLPPSLRRRLQSSGGLPLQRCGDSRAWERRWLTVVFVDLAGFTALAERLEAELLAGVLDRWLGAMVECAERHGGEVSKMLGDGVLVVFDPDDRGGRRAGVTAALSFCREVPVRLHGLAEALRGQGELVELQARAGAASGVCTLGDRGGGGRLDFTVVGAAVNLASRLQRRAPLAGVLVDAATAALAEPGFELSPPRALQLKGLGSVVVRALVDPAVASAKVPAPLPFP